MLLFRMRVMNIEDVYLRSNVSPKKVQGISLETQSSSMIAICEPAVKRYSFFHQKLVFSEPPNQPCLEELWAESVSSVFGRIIATRPLQ